MSENGRMDWRELDPIPPENRPALPEKLSQSILARQAVCPRSALLYHRHRGGAGSLEMERGSVFHEFARRAVLELMEQNEPRMPPEVARDLMQAVMDDPQWTVSPKEADRLRVMAYHFAEGFTIDPSTILALETMIELDLGWVKVRGKVDLAFAPDDATIAVWDYKSSLAVPSQEDFEGLFQVPFYAVLLAFGKPEGDALPFGDRAQSFDLAQVYPMLEPRDGMFARTVTVTRAELSDHRRYVESVAMKLRYGFETGDFPAIPGPHCSTCPAKHECPLPPALRGAGGDIETDDDASAAGARLFFMDKEKRELQKSVREYAKANGVTVVFGDMEWRFETEESESWITGKRINRPDTEAAREAMLAAIDRAVKFGEAFDYWEYRKKARSSKFVCRPREDGEPEPEPEPAPARDFGEKAPF